MGYAALSAGVAQGRLDGLTLTLDGVSKIESTEGSSIEFNQHGRGGQFILSGEGYLLEVDFDVDWPERASWSIRGNDLNTSILEGLLDFDAGWRGIETVRSDGEWAGGPAQYS